MQFHFKTAFTLGGDVFKARYATLLQAVVAALCTGIATLFILEWINSSLATVLVYVFFGLPFLSGISLLALRHVRGESPRVLAIFDGFRRYWTTVGIGALLSAIMLAGPGVFMVSFYLALGGNVIVTLLITLSCLELFLIVRLLFAPLLCIDPRCRLGIMHSIETSWRLTSAFFWPLLGIGIIIIIFWLLLGVGLTLVLIVSFQFILLVLPALLLGIPFLLVVLAAAYELITREAPVVRIIKSARAKK